MPTDSRWHADHAALETQLLAVLDALIALRPARAAAAFARFAALLDAHLFAEESELLPRLAALPAPRWAPALYLAEPEVMLDVLQGASGQVVAMLGHNPGIGQMAGRLLAEAPDHPDFDRYPTLATLIADFDIDDWADVSWGSGRAVDFIVPRALLPD